MEQTVLSFPGRLLLASPFRQESYSKMMSLPHLQAKSKKGTIYVLSEAIQEW